MLYRYHHSSILFVIVFILHLIALKNSYIVAADEEDVNSGSKYRDDMSSFSRRLSSAKSITTNPVDPIIRRKHYYGNTDSDGRSGDNNKPHVCLAFLSCCDRLDLLNATIYGAIRHMEEDELPATKGNLRYEIAWVDNYSEEAEETIANNYQIEHALMLPSNYGMAYGLNLLIHNLCTAPYILLLEEDWLFVDDILFDQTPTRKRVVGTAVSWLEQNKNNRHNQENKITAFDGREVAGVFLRAETYPSFLKFPHMDVWQKTNNLNMEQVLLSMNNKNGKDESCDSAHKIGNYGDNTDNDGSMTTLKSSIDDVSVHYQIYCADISLAKGNVWGSYTNGAGLYRRSDLIDVGRMYGEPGDPFNYKYTESNYAYRVGINYCHASLMLSDEHYGTNNDGNKCDINRLDAPVVQHKECVAAFHHIGGGRGTRPQREKVEDLCNNGGTWMFYKTPMYHRYFDYYKKLSGKEVQKCSNEELEKLQSMNFEDNDSEEYRLEVKEINEQIFKLEKDRRDEIQTTAEYLLTLLDVDDKQLDINMGMIINSFPWADEHTTVEEIFQYGNKMKRLADSMHPLDGFWDSHGRPIDQNNKDIIHI